MERLDPQYEQWLAEQGMAPAGFMNRGPLSDIPGRPLAPKQPMQPQYGGGGMPQGPHMMPDGTMMGGSDQAPPSGQGLPRQITRPRNADLYGGYVQTYDAGRGMGMGMGQPPAEPEAEDPFYLSHTGAGMGGSEPGMPGNAPVDPRDAEMAARFPRAYALQQKLNQQRQMATMAQQAAAMAPQMEAETARQKADTEISLMQQKGELEGEAMRRKFAATEAQMDQQQRKAQMQQQQQMAQQQMGGMRPPVRR